MKYGLSQTTAEERIKKYGLNEIETGRKVTILELLWRQVKSNFIIFLLASAFLLSLSVGKYTTAITILIVILIVILVGFVQEYKAEKSIEALRNLLIPLSIVIRDGLKIEIESRSIVPGDLVVIKAGDKVPADGKLIESINLQVNEASLTGESVAVNKDYSSKINNSNKVFMGTYVVNGKGTFEVSHTGMNTSFGKIAHLISTAEKPMTLQKKINSIAKFMVGVAITSSLILALLILSRTEQLNYEIATEILILVIALCVSAFPEGLPVVLITTLAVGARRMAQKNAIVGRMSIIETLGEVSVICTDKTGTITKGEMTVKGIYDGSETYEVSGVGYETKGEILYQGKKVEMQKNANLKLLMEAIIRCNDAEIQEYAGEIKTIGTPTEVALLILGAKGGFAKNSFPEERSGETPFSSDRKMMSVLTNKKEGSFIFCKGAPEKIIQKSSHFIKQGKVHKLTKSKIEEIQNIGQDLSKQSFRTIAIAFKKVNSTNIESEEDNLIFLGLLALSDPPRVEVKESLKLAKESGVKVVMITGDHKETAISIAIDIGLNTNTITGEELDNLSDAELDANVKKVDIFARVRPDHKIRIVKSITRNGEIVAMTGDGVKDAPALKEAHVSIAMGKNGTDVSRSSSDLILKDDNFATIISAIKEGRTIFSNIRKFVIYQLSCNSSQLIILLVGVLLAPLLDWRIPILASIQILFMNLVTDNMPALTLGLNPTSEVVMKSKPQKNKKILNSELILLILVTATVMSSLTLISYFISHNIMINDYSYSQTIAMTTLILLMIATAFNFRSFKKFTINRNLFVNQYLFFASIASIIATIIFIYTPLNFFMETVPLRPTDWIVPILLTFVGLVIQEIIKFFNIRRKNYLDLVK